MTVLLLGGPAGAGKSALARAWCATQPLAAHIELDTVRQLIVGGLADPQEPGELQEAQYGLSVEATCALARTFAGAGYDVAVDDVLEPEAFERCWRPSLDGLSWKLVIVLPALDETLERAGRRAKRVHEHHIRTQHARSTGWDPSLVLDTSGLTLEQSLDLLRERLA